MILLNSRRPRALHATCSEASRCDAVRLTAKTDRKHSLSERAGGGSAVTSPSVFERLRAHGDIPRGVRHAGVAHELLQLPSSHPAIGLSCASGVAKTVRVHRKIDLGLLPGSLDHLVDGEAAEGIAALAGEDVAALRLLLTLQPLQAIGFVALQVVDAVDAALQSPDLDGASTPVDIIPAQINQLTDAEAMQVRHQRDHVIPLAMAIALERSEQALEFLWEQMFPLAIGGV